MAFLDKPYQALNGALMHFERHSPYLCSLLAVMAASPLPKKGTTAWGAHLYQRTLRRLLHAGVRPFEVLPWCLTDPRNCRVDKRVPDPFKADPSWFMGKRWVAGGREALKVRTEAALLTRGWVLISALAPPRRRTCSTLAPKRVSSHCTSTISGRRSFRSAAGSRRSSLNR